MCLVLNVSNRKMMNSLESLNLKAQEGIFLGYSLESKAYSVYVIDHKKFIESMNVTFDDNKLPEQSS